MRNFLKSVWEFVAQPPPKHPSELRRETPVHQYLGLVVEKLDNIPAGFRAIEVEAPCGRKLSICFSDELQKVTGPMDAYGESTVEIFW